MSTSLRLDHPSSTPSQAHTSPSTLPRYAPLATLDASSSSARRPPPRARRSQPAQRHAAAAAAVHSPALARFLADFTLGFADGLTVPFALTAGLSSLGQTQTVRYAGMAEICAGSISMGIGGYLSARGGRRGAAAVDDDNDAAASRVEEEEVDDKAGRVVDRYLALLDLPPELLDVVQEHIAGRGDVAAAVERRIMPAEDGEEEEDGLPPPWVSGLSVAAGYLIGGSLPLLPYFTVREVGDGILWSFVVCVVALFIFGFSKDFVLHRQGSTVEVWVEERGVKRAGWRWQDIRRSSWEGAQMVILGSLAALAAVLCVRLLEGMDHNNV